MQAHDPSEFPDAATTAALERAAVRLARAAGEYIREELTRSPVVVFKNPIPGTAANSNPVSQTDRHVELLIREQLAAEFPDHSIIGEEFANQGAHAGPFTWVIDPVDGTTNYINGVPLFASSIGVLFQGRPVAGAIWCASTHALKPGIYHAREGGLLQFDGLPLERRTAAAWRGLASEPGRAPTYGALWDTRVLGCATLEFAFVAAGLLRMAYLPRPALWDAAAGLALLHAAHCHAVAVRGPQADTLLYFGQPGDPVARLSCWSEPLLIGDEVSLRGAIAGRSAASSVREQSGGEARGMEVAPNAPRG